MNQTKIRTKQVDWEKEYRQSGLWEKKPHKYSVLASQNVLNGKILDIGCGEGHDCLYFASKNYDVTGIDISKLAIRKMIHEANKKNLKVKAITGDIKHLHLKEKYDIISSYGVLQFLGDKFYRYIYNLKNITHKNGVHSLYIFGDKGDFYNIAKHKFAFPSEKNLRELYNDWQILMFESKIVNLLMRGDKGELLYNKMYKILVKKGEKNE